MTIDERASANETTLPNELADHIQDAQNRAIRLHGVMCAIDYLDNEDGCAEGITALIHTARDMSDDLQRALDSVNLPKGAENDR